MPRLRASESAARRCRAAATPTARSAEVARIRQNTAHENGSSRLAMKRSRASSSCSRGMAVKIINGMWDMASAMPRGDCARARMSTELRTAAERSLASENRLRTRLFGPGRKRAADEGRDHRRGCGRIGVRRCARLARLCARNRRCEPRPEEGARSGHRRPIRRRALSCRRVAGRRLHRPAGRFTGDDYRWLQRKDRRRHRPQ